LIDHLKKYRKKRRSEGTFGLKSERGQTRAEGLISLEGGGIRGGHPELSQNGG